VGEGGFLGLAGETVVRGGRGEGGRGEGVDLITIVPVGEVEGLLLSSIAVSEKIKGGRGHTCN
jgi:hypothetical protein